MQKSSKILVFGVFDHLHPGHRAFLRQAKKHGGKLVVVVARDSAAKKLKNKKPHQSERKRMAALREIHEAWKVVLGDRKQSSYSVIKKHKPDIICFGYDQKWLPRDLYRQMQQGKISRTRTVKLKAYQPTKYHTSRIENKKMNSTPNIIVKQSADCLTIMSAGAIISL